MKILRCHIRGFGRFQELMLRFNNGLNLVFAENEGGKSTLLRFLVGLLYGPWRPEIKSQRRPEAWIEQYKPWNSTEYGGGIFCRLEDGRELEIQRSFGREDPMLEIRAQTGEDVSSRYDRQRNGELLVAQHHLRLSKDMFESLAVIRENRAVELEGRETLRDRLANLAQTGDEQISVRLGLSRLEQALESVGSERAPTKPFRRAIERLQALREEQQALRSRREEYEDWIGERSRAAQRIAELEQEQLRSRAMVRLARLNETESRVRSLEDIDRELRKIRVEMERVGGDPSFPVHLLDELSRLQWHCAEGRRQVEQMRAAREKQQARLATVKDDLSRLEAYAALQATLDSDRVTEWFVSYLGLSRQSDERQKELESLEARVGAMRHELQQLGPQVSSPATDWIQVAQEAAERENELARRSTELADKIAGERKRLLAEKGKRLKHAALGLGASAVSTASLWWSTGTPDGLPTLGAVGLLLAIGAILPAVFFWAAAVQSHRRVRITAGIIAELESERNLHRSAINMPQERLRRAASEAGPRETDDFLAACRKASDLRRQIDGLAENARRTASERERTHMEALAVYAQLRGALTRVGLACTPGTLKEQIDILRSTLRRCGELETECRDLEQRIRTAEDEETRAASEIAGSEARLQAILAEGKVGSPDAFREACKASRHLLGLRDREMSRVGEFRRLSGERSLEEWKAVLSDLQLPEGELPQPLDGSHGQHPSSGGLPLPPPVPSLTAAEEKERRVGAELSQAREHAARLAERIEQAFHGFRSDAEIDEDILQAEAAVRSLARSRQALILAAATIREIARQQQEASAPQLGRAVEARFLRICGPRYQEVKVDPDFRVRVRESVSGQLREAECLSRGTQDQLYFSLRFGILELLGAAEEPCPCLLDEPFAAYDRRRIEQAFRILAEEAAARQLFVFTCREDVRDTARDHGAVEVGLG